MSTELESITVMPDKAPTHLVIWLHGLGADGSDFQSMAQEIALPDSTYAKFVFPHAPIRPITLNAGMEMRGWYDIKGMELTDRQDVQGVQDASHAVLKLITKECEDHRIDFDQVILAGFSQGGAIALYAGLTAPFRLAGVMALSTYLPIESEFTKNRSKEATKTPIFQAHGSHDPVVIEDWGKMSFDHLKELGYSIEYQSYPMAHQVCMEEIKDIEKWMTGRLQN